MIKKVVYFLRWGHWPKKFRYPNGIPRVISPEARYVAQQMQLVELGEIDYDEFRVRMQNYGREHG